MKNWKAYELHELCECFPKFEPEELEKLKKDIEENGQRDPITLYDGKILDGQNRYAVALELKKPPHFEEFKGKDPVAFVISKNLSRRHLTTSQRSMIAARLLTNKDEGSTVGKNYATDKETGRFATAEVSEEKAAQLAKVSRKNVSKAKKVIKKSNRLANMVSKGEVSLNAAAKVASMPKKKRERIASKGAKAVKAAAVPRGGLFAAKKRQEVEGKAGTVLEVDGLGLTDATLKIVRDKINGWYQENKKQLSEPQLPEPVIKKLIKDCFV